MDLEMLSWVGTACYATELFIAFGVSYSFAELYKKRSLKDSVYILWDRLNAPLGPIYKETLSKRECYLRN